MNFMFFNSSCDENSKTEKIKNKNRNIVFCQQFVVAIGLTVLYYGLNNSAQLFKADVDPLQGPWFRLVQSFHWLGKNWSKLQYFLSLKIPLMQVTAIRMGTTQKKRLVEPCKLSRPSVVPVVCIERLASIYYYDF